MRHSKLIGSLIAVGILGSAVSLSTFGFRKVRESGSGFSMVENAFNRTSLQKHAVPMREASSLVNRQSETEAPILRGLVVSGSTPYICEFKAEKGLRVKNIFSDEDMPEASGGAFCADGKYYVMTLYSPYVGEYDTYMTVYDAESWDIIDEKDGLLPSSSGYSMTYDPITNAVYGYFANDEMDSTWHLFGRMNIATGEVTGLNNVDVDDSFVALAASTDGFLYGINKNGMFCRVTKNGEITMLGHTDIKPAYVQSAVIDPMTGRFYWAGFTDEGKGGLYEVNMDTYLASLIESFPNNQEIVGLYIVENVVKSDMPADVKDLEANFIRDTMEGTVSFTAPDMLCGGKQISGNLTAHVAIDGNHYEKSVAPGRSVTFEVGTNCGGLQNIAVWTVSDNVASRKSYVQKWAGSDRPTGIRNLKAEVEDTKVTLTWDAPTEGQHGGYINPDEITYIIDRDGYGMNHVRDYISTTFVDELGEGVSADVRYSVRSVYQDFGGPTVYSDWIHVGNELLQVPFTLSPSGDFNKFIIIDANNDDNTWTASWGGYALYEGGSEPADDWMLTPEISMEAGRVYELVYNASAKMGFMSPEVIEVKAGIGENPSDMSLLIDSQTVKTIGITKFTEYSATFSVPTSGNYRLGFHALSANGQQLGLQGIKVNSLTSIAGPVSATDLIVTPADKGVLKASVSFVLPSEDAAGEKLTSISKAELYNGDRLAATAENLTPGEKCTLTDEEASQGTNRYSVICYGPDGTKGLVASTSSWVGVDIPSLPTDIEISEIANGVRLNWNISETGINGGYVNPSEVVYLIVDPTYGSEIAVVKGVTQTDVIFENLPDTQVTLSLGLMVMNSAGQNEEGVLSPTIMVGPAYTLPIHEHFAKNTDYGWCLIGSVDEDAIGWSPDEEAAGPDGQKGLSSYYGEIGEDTQKLATGKVAIPAGSDAVLRMWIKCMGGADGGKFNILASETFGKNYEPIYTETITSSTKYIWKPVEVSLKKYAGKEIYFALEGAPEEDGQIVVVVDELTIRESVDYDGFVSAIYVDTDEVEVAGKKASVNAWVGNHGLKAMENESYSIDFYAGERLFASVPGRKLDPSFGFTDYTVEYTPTTDDTDPTLISARLNYDKDMNLANNKSNGVSVYVVLPDLPIAGELSATTDENGVILNWEAADVNEKPVRTIVEDFENYRTWSNGRVGDWTIVDEDQSPGASVSYVFPGSNGPLGWIVMEPRAIPIIEGGTTHADRQPAFSGEKYMAAFRPSDGDNKDWLITPELSGNAQEISFMARAESFNQGREMFEVYYSKTGTDLKDMIRLDDTDYRTEPKGWSEFRFNVPEGAKYFAVRCVSHNRLAMHIDYFTYESAATPVDGSFIGYNVYRNGELINDVPVTALSFKDYSPVNGDNTYYVRAVYNVGESPVGNKVTVSVSGVTAISADVDPVDTPVYTLDGIRVFNLIDGEIYVSKGIRFVYRKF